MNTWKTLYIKEMKDNRTLFVLLVAVTVFLELVAVWSLHMLPSDINAWSSDEQPATFSSYFPLSLVPYAFLLVLPFLLVHSFAQEVKGQTHYLLLSLPVSRAKVFAAKVATVATLGIVLFVLSTAGFITVVGQLLEFIIQADKMNVSGVSEGIRMDLSSVVLISSGAFWLSAMALMLGIASGVAGLKLVVRRFAGLASTAFVLGVLYCYFSALPEILSATDFPDAYTALFQADSAGSVQINMAPEFLKIHFALVAYSIFVGLASMGIGMWLFEKRAEA